MTTATPVPASAIALMAGVALWLTVMDPVLAPAVVGLKLVVNAQLAPIASEAPAVHVFAAIAKSAPARIVDAIVSAAVPELVSVVTCAAAVDPTFVEGNVTVAADSVATGAPVVQVTVGVAMYAPKSANSEVVSLPSRNFISVTLLVAALITGPLLEPFLNLFWFAAGLGPWHAPLLQLSCPATMTFVYKVLPLHAVWASEIELENTVPSSKAIGSRTR